MRVLIYGQGMQVERTLREYAQRRLQFALGRFSTRISDVVIRLTDENADRGGVDRRCRIVTHLLPTGTLVIEELGENVRAVIDRAADRAGRAVGRELRRRWEARRRFVPQTHEDRLRHRAASLAFWYRP